MILFCCCTEFIVQRGSKPVEPAMLDFRRAWNPVVQNDETLHSISKVRKTYYELLTATIHIDSGAPFLADKKQLI